MINVEPELSEEEWEGIEPSQTKELIKAIIGVLVFLVGIVLVIFFTFKQADLNDSQRHNISVVGSNYNGE